jgi:GntR family carbon starvation induced transcriptional regulator
MQMAKSRKAVSKPRREKSSLKLSSETLTGTIYLRLRHDIISTRLKPGARLTIADICKQYDVSLSPAREALNRIISEGLILQNESRRLQIAPLTVEDLDQLTRTRCWLNGIGLTQSIANGDAAWEERVVLACYRLSRIPRYIDGSEPDRNPEWEVAHRVFHEALISACGSKWLIGFCQQLFDASERYRYLARISAVTRPRHQDEHSQIMEAATARDADSAVKLLNEHFQRTADLGRRQIEPQNGQRNAKSINRINKK